MVWKYCLSNSRSKGWCIIMGYIEIFRMDNEGAGWVDLAEATPDELFNIELGLLEEGAFE
mgnify:FL=1